MSHNSFIEKMHWVHYVSMVIVLMYAAGVGYYPQDSQVGLEGAQPLTAPLRYSSFIAAAYYLLTFGSQVSLFIFKHLKVLLSLLVLCLASIFWSTNPTATFNGCLDLLAITIVTVSLALKGGTQFVLRTVIGAGLVILLISLVSAAAGLDFAVMAGEHRGRWRGLFAHKNRLGEFTAILLAVVVCFRPPIKLITKWSVVVVALPLLVFAQSSTAWAVLAIILLSAWVVRFIQKITKRRLATYAILTTLAGLTAFILPSILELTADALGRDTSFTGRDRVWLFFYDRTLLSPWLGSGWNSYWADERLMLDAGAALFNKIRSPHNGYIHMALGIGWVGVTLYVVWLFKILNDNLSRARNYKPAAGLIGLLCGVSTLGMFEISGALGLSFGSFLIIALSTSLLAEQVRGSKNPTPDRSAAVMKRRYSQTAVSSA